MEKKLLLQMSAWSRSEKRASLFYALFIAAVLLSLVPVTSVMAQVKPTRVKPTKVKPQKERVLIKEDTNLLSEEEIKERMATETRIAVPGANASSDDADAAVLRVTKIENPSMKEEDKIFDVTEQQPTFASGNLAEWLNQHTVYPAAAVGSGVEGRVIVRFVVERDGTVSNVEVARSLGPLFDQEAIRVVKSMPKWNPAMQNGAAVRCRHIVPVIFKKP